MSGVLLCRWLVVLGVAMACAGCPSSGGTVYRDNSGAVVDSEAAQYFMRGNEEAKGDRLASALDCFNRAIAIDPDHGDFYYNRGLVFQALGRHDEAIADFTRAIRKGPKVGDAYLMRARSHAAQSAAEAAVADLEAGMPLRKINVSADDAARIIAEVKQAVARATRSGPYAAGSVDPSVAAMLAELGWTDLRGLERACAAMQKDNSATAIGELTQVIAERRDCAAAYGIRGMLRQRLGQNEAAIEDLTRAIELQPEIASSYLLRGHARRALAQNQQALVDYTRAIELTPQNANGYYGRAMCYVDLNRREQAVADFTRTIELAPQFATAYRFRGACCMDLGRYDMGINDCRQALELAPSDPECLNALAWWLTICPDIRHRDPAAALPMAQKAVAAQPDNWQFIDTLACAYAATGDFKKAIEIERRALELCPDAEFRKQLQNQMQGFQQGRDYRAQQMED